MRSIQLVALTVLLGMLLFNIERWLFGAGGGWLSTISIWIAQVGFYVRCKWDERHGVL